MNDVKRNEEKGVNGDEKERGKQGEMPRLKGGKGRQGKKCDK